MSATIAAAATRTVSQLEAEIARLQSQNDQLAAAASSPVKAFASAYVNKKTGKVAHVVEIRGDFYPISLKLDRARDIAAIADQIVAAADDCEARRDELAQEAVDKYKTWLSKQS